MMSTMKEWVADGIRSSGWLLWAPLVAAYAPRGLPQMYFNLHLRRYARRLVPFLDQFVTIDIVRKASSSTGHLKSNDAYQEVKAYLSSACSRDVLDLCAEGTVKGDRFLFSLRAGQEVADHFRDVTLWWLSVPLGGDYGSGSNSTLRLMFPQRHRKLIMDEYLPHVRREGRDLMFGKRGQRLYTNKRGFGALRSDVWRHIDFEHPTTFDTLAMHPDKKRRITEDLDRFRGNKDYYRQIGKPWKRGYLLCGPPGTGKSTMIAAMANYLKYDIYDIELTMVASNGDLRKLFVETTAKSIIVIEDIDCSFDDFTGERRNQGRSQKKIMPSSGDNSNKVTLSGLLNFIDGVWSAESGERIIVLTTNFPEKLDQALVRCGRMDMHVEMSYCGFEAFKTLAWNYLGVRDHDLFKSVEKLLQVVEITPADVAECLLPSQPDVAKCLLPSLADVAPSQADVAECPMMYRCSDRGVETCLGRLIDELKRKAEEEKEKDKVEVKAAKPNGTGDMPGRRGPAVANGGTSSGTGASGNIGDPCPSEDISNETGKAEAEEAMAVD